MRTLHGALSSSIPDKTLSRYTLRVAKENTKIETYFLPLLATTFLVDRFFCRA